MKKWILLAFIALSTPAISEVLPRPGPGDPHLQSIGYDPDQVVALRVAPGFAVTLQLAPDERVENISVGNASAWQVQSNKRGDVVFIKLLNEGAVTNLTILTDTRRYSFKLYPTSSDDPSAPYALSFTYPKPPPEPQPEIAVETTRFRLRGDKTLWPVAMSDDGEFTSIAWAPDATLPAVYRIDARGKQVLVNGIVREGAYVIEGIAAQFVFRLGKARATATRMVTSGSGL